ncbi:hypothetical protein Bca101_057590 [Brassica carinata]
MTTGSLSKSSPRMLQYHIDDHDRIRKLPDVLLQMIVSKLSTEESLRTSVLSSRWVDVWKCMSHIVLDTRGVLDTTPEEHKHLHRLSVRLARSMTKWIFSSFPLPRGDSVECQLPNPHGVLKIENNSLKLLQLSFPNDIDRMEVYATFLNVLDIDSRFINAMRDNFILVAPNIQVNKNAWLDHGDCPHLYYNVLSNLAQLLGRNFDNMRRSGCLSVSVDINDPKEMEILKEILLRYWTKLVMELEIFFRKNKATREKGETSTSDKTHEKPFPKTVSCFYNVRLYNFDGSKEEEFAFVSRLVMQERVIKMMIETSLFPPTKKFNAEATVAKLMELPKCNKHIKIECF